MITALDVFPAKKLTGVLLYLVYYSFVKIKVVLMIFTAI